jgi:hypothetical protein
MHSKNDIFNNQVALNYQLFNSLFLTLPYAGISSTGSFLPLLAQKCEQGLKQGATPEQIIHDFFENHHAQLPQNQQIDMLFKFIQYIERQVVLFDAVEDAVQDEVEEVHDEDGKDNDHDEDVDAVVDGDAMNEPSEVENENHEEEEIINEELEKEEEETDDPNDDAEKVAPVDGPVEEEDTMEVETAQ